MKADPGLAERLGEIFIMGGNIEGFCNVTEAAEFNFHADPEAAFTVLRLTRCPTTIAPWELSYKYNNVDFFGIQLFFHESLKFVFPRSMVSFCRVMVWTLQAWRYSQDLHKVKKSTSLGRV